MALSKIEVDTDVKEMAIRLAGRIGKSLSDTLQDGLIYLCRENGWSVTVDEEEQLDDGEREEVYVFWSGLDPEQRGLIMDLMEDMDRLGELGEQKKLHDRIAELEGLLKETPVKLTSDESPTVEITIRGNAENAGGFFKKVLGALKRLGDGDE
jgi:hypothetical protein